MVARRDMALLWALRFLNMGLLPRLLSGRGWVGPPCESWVGLPCCVWWSGHWWAAFSAFAEGADCWGGCSPEAPWHFYGECDSYTWACYHVFFLSVVGLGRPASPGWGCRAVCGGQVTGGRRFPPLRKVLTAGEDARQRRHGTSMGSAIPTRGPVTTSSSCPWLGWAALRVLGGVAVLCVVVRSLVGGVFRLCGRC